MKGGAGDLNGSYTNGCARRPRKVPQKAPEVKVIKDESDFNTEVMLVIDCIPDK